METAAKKNWWQRSWTIPLSLLLHVLIVAVYLQWPNTMEASTEPESVNVELVEPPKEEPPAKPEEKKPEEKKAEEEPPPPAQEQPKSPPVVQPPIVAVRPSPTQLDELDEPGEQEAGGQQQPKPEEQADTAQPATTPVDDVRENEPKPEPTSMEAKSEEGEIPASQNAAPDDPVASVVVPLPKPELKPAPEQPQKAQPDGSVDPDLKPAKKIIAGAKRPGPMLRQIFGNLPPRERVAQLCVAEAMAQIRDQRKGQTPYEGLKPHTGRNYPVVGNVFDAQGAFNVGLEWYSYNYRCEVDIENYIVTEFRSKTGPKLSADDVKRLGLAARE